jgi:hypothetical protein
VGCLVQIAAAGVGFRLGTSSWLMLAHTAALLFLGGLAYAGYIAIRPFRARLTWFSVVDGCAYVNTSTSIGLYILTRDWLVTLTPWIAYAIAGLCMIAFQVYKYAAMDQVVNAEMEAENNAE